MEKTDPTLRDRLLKGMSSQMFGQAVQITIRLSEVPLFLSFWGASRYGEWLMLAAIPTYLSMADGGFTQTACKDITIRASSGDRQGALATYQSIWALLLALSTIICIAAVIIAKFAPLSKWLKFSGMTIQETSVVFLILVGFILIGFQGGLYNSGFWASGHYPLSMFFNAIILLISFGGMAIAISLKGGPIQVATGYFLGKLLGTIILFCSQRKECPWLILGFKHASIKEIKRLFAPSFAALAFPVGNALNVEGVRLAIGLTLGPTALAMFVPLRTLSNFVDVPCQVIKALTEPEMAIAFGGGSITSYRKLFIESVRISFWSCFALGIVLIPTGRWIIIAWTANKILFNWDIYIFLVFAAILNSIWTVAILVSYSTNRHGKTGLYYMAIYGFTFVGLTIIFAKYTGIIGPAIALLIVEIIMNILVIPQALKLTETTMVKELFTFINPPIGELVSEIIKVNQNIKNKKSK